MFGYMNLGSLLSIYIKVGIYLKVEIEPNGKPVLTSPYYCTGNYSNLRVIIRNPRSSTEMSEYTEHFLISYGKRTHLENKIMS